MVMDNKRAAVYCIIIGFSDYKNSKEKKIFDSENDYKVAKNINPYLVNAPNILIKKRSEALDNVPKIKKGCYSTDNGNYIFSEQQKNDFINIEPLSKEYFRRWVGAKNMIHNKKIYILYLRNCPPDKLKQMKCVLKLIENVKEYRKISSSEETRKKALTPHLFVSERIPKSKFLVIPGESSGDRYYIPMRYKMPPDICSGKVFFIEGATLYHFGVLTSSVHMAWTSAVCGRLGNEYRYSTTIVYNNFIWPNPTIKQKEVIENAAQAVLDARKLYPDKTLAYLYNPETMPPELLEAHQKLDAAVKDAYGDKGFNTEEEIVASLMKMYKEITGKEKAGNGRGLNL